MTRSMWGDSGFKQRHSSILQHRQSVPCPRHRHLVARVCSLAHQGDLSAAPVGNRQWFEWDWRSRDYEIRTLLYFLISRTKLVKASSTLIRCLADVSMNLQPKCFARSRPSDKRVQHQSHLITRQLGHPITRTIHTDLTFILQVALVRHHNYRERILVFHSENLLVECADLLKRVP